MTLNEKLKSLPKVSGIYKFFNQTGEIIYIGKAKNLNSRVGSYFSTSVKEGTKTHALVTQITDMAFVETLTELEALLLEAELIKTYKPKYNILLKDDKSYLYIVFRNEKGISVPKISTCRESDLLEKDLFFGPYPDGSTPKQIVRHLRKVIPYRDCNANKYTRYQKLGRSCLYGDIGLCKAPCVNSQNSVLITEIKKDMLDLKHILRGDASSVLAKYETLMRKYSKEQDYEKATIYRDLIKKFNYVRQTFKVAQKYIDNPMLVEDIIHESLQSIVDALPFISEVPRRIECYDMSNISGTSAVGAMTVAINGRLKNSEYRKYKIKTKNTPDDFEMMREVLRRRLKHTEWATPDLIVLDGGKGQVSSVMQVLDEFNIEIPLVGLAKKHELLVYYADNKWHEIELSRTNEGLKLIQRLRDEAHRFGKEYHHKLTLKKLTS